MEELLKVFVDNGMAMGITIYFLFKDWKLTQRLTDTLSAVNEHLRKEEQDNEIKNLIEKGR